MARFLLIFWLIFYSLRYRTKPWNFFQLNHTYFSREKNIFSKLDLDSHIPEKWRLGQWIDDGHSIPEFPVFVKPEWGQNSHGVGVARNRAELNDLRANRRDNNVAYLMQEAAAENREFEFFYIRRVDNLDDYEMISLTETINTGKDDLVVNGINNDDSVYRDVDCDLDDKQRAKLWQIFNPIGCFYIARVGVKANSIAELLEGAFHVVEVNIFLPMPLVLLDDRISKRDKHRFIRRAMKGAAKLAAKVDVSGAERCSIFFKQLIAHYKVKE
ncbi:MAG: hypothetical protein ACI8ZB_002336 [Desulforhopalus sp.]|jgi:hypothetical protein